MIQIQAIPFGQKEATNLNLVWAEIPFDSDTFKVKAEFCDSETNCLYRDEKEYSKDDYYALGETKEARTEAVITAFGAIKVAEI